jgi:adenosylhomocysteine nucleosidase
MRIGVMGALPHEVSRVRGSLDRVVTERRAGRSFHSGRWGSHRVVVVHARIGKVAAAITAAELIVRQRVDLLLFTGLAGAIDPTLAVGDLVLAEGLVQHDLDASPLFSPMEIPLTGVSRIEATPSVLAAMEAAAQRLGMRARRGDIATGDRFIADDAARDEVRRRVPSALCVEMEGAAVAQVCHEYGLPFGIVRIISDAADGAAAEAFTDALAGRLADTTAALLREVVQGIGPDQSIDGPAARA